MAVEVIRADFEAVVWLIIVVATVIGQVVKAARNKMNPPDGTEEPSSQTPHQPARTPQQELEVFLKSLRGGTVSPPSPPSQPPPPPLPRVPRPMRVNATSQVREPTRVPIQQPAKPEMQPVMQAIPLSALPNQYDKKRGSQQLNDLRISLGMDLIQTQSLRKAILLQEIFGKPLGLRKNSGAPQAAELRS